MPRLGFTGRLSYWSARHRWIVIGAWVASVIAIAAAGSTVGGAYTTDITFTNDPESQTARDLIRGFRGADPLFEQVIVQSDTLTVDDPAFGEFVAGLLAELRSQPEFFVPEQSFSYFETGVEDLVSADRRITLVPVLLNADLDTAPAALAVLEEAIHARADSGFSILYGGFGSFNEDFNRAAEEDLGAELRALPIALVILILVFGAVTAALLPMGVAFTAIGATFGLLQILNNAWQMSAFVPNVTLMIGLAVGIDYALFVVARFREQRRLGYELYEAIGIAGDTASRAVFFSGGTVVIALMGMFIVPTSIFRGFAVGASMVVILAVMGSLTLLPALLAALGDKVNSLSLPFVKKGGLDDDTGFWAGAARFVMRYPLPMALLSSAFLIALAIPYFSINLGASGASALPEHYNTRQAFEVLDREFLAGRAQPAEVVVQTTDATQPAIQAALDSFIGALTADPQYAVLNSVSYSPDNTLAVVSVALPGDVTSDEAIAAMKRIRTDFVPAAFGEVDARVYVGGNTAGNSDFFDLVGVYTPWVFAFVLGFSFVLLMMIFRSLVVPVKSIIMNLLSVGAAYGVIVAIFQWGWGADLLGFQTVDAIEAWLPLFMFTILFGLSMDYHIFLLSRIRERFDETADNTGSVAFGLRTTANIITGAAAIMVAVFGGFALGDFVVFQQIGVGLAVSVFLDATIVRTILVPATMRLLGDTNWYMPSWLHWLPDLRVEKEPVSALESELAAGKM
ncbi:MAG: MMPL family transporter, partial [Chloroflexi bacterium]|nr:MMPL family transporter [Chloroflexota bacterium]